MNATTKAAHTPGPWQALIHRGGRERTYPLVVSMAPGHDEMDEDAICEVTSMLRQADARLIAAAPELLAACEASLGIIQSAGPAAREVLKRVEAAIAKAVGK